MEIFLEALSSPFYLAMPSFVIALTLAIALAMDAFAVSIVAGCQLVRPKRGQYGRMALTFALFQCVMFIIGYFLSNTVVGMIAHFATGSEADAHIMMSERSANSILHGATGLIASIILLIIGLKMGKESFEELPVLRSDPSKGLLLVALAFATSLDALLVGLSVHLLESTSVAEALPTSFVIGFVCGILSLLGMFIGAKLRKWKFLGKRAELLGGLVLILIACHSFYNTFNIFLGR